MGRWLRLWLWAHRELLKAGTGAKVVIPLGSGYNKMAEQAELVKRLKAACELAMAKYPAKDEDKDGVPEETYCNFAVRDICKAMGHDEWGGLTANKIHAKLLASKEWRMVNGERASKAALDGRLAIAAATGKDHGHVAICYPGPMQVSGKWAKSVPLVANVGKKNGVMGANWAFPVEPDYFTREEDV